MATRLGPLPPGADRPRRPWSLTLVTRVHLDCRARWLVLHLLRCLHEISITHCATLSIHFFYQDQGFFGIPRNPVTLSHCYTVTRIPSHCHTGPDPVNLSQSHRVCNGNQDPVTLSHWRKIDQPGTVVLNMREQHTMSQSGKLPRARGAKMGIFGSRVVRV